VVVDDDGTRDPEGTARALWSACSTYLREQVPEPLWNVWFGQLVPLATTNDALTLSAPSAFIKEGLLSRFQPLLEDALTKTAPDTVLGLDIVIAPPAPQESDPDHQAGLTHSQPGHLPPASSTPASPPPPPTRHRNPPPGLNPRYTFEAFVTGESNRFASAAAQRVAEEPARAYNPLFIYGGSGLGKTHILHAIGNYVATHFATLDVCYVPTETFLNDFIDAIRTKDQTAFKRRYRTHDVLLVDDVQLLGGKTETQEEFFYTFNALYEAQKQVVLCSDRHPKAIATLEDRLRSRFESGLMTDIQPPELETRIAILRKKAEGEAAQIPDDVLELIATSIKDNIRELEGALIRLVAFASIEHAPITAHLAEKVLSDVLSNVNARQIALQQILEQSAGYYNFTVEELRGPSRTRPLVFARQVAMYLMRELTDYSLSDIARELGNRDHSTVLHGWKKISSQMRDKRAIYDQVTELMRRIRANA
jgi:chromosomal replication initiator protein